MEKTEKKVALTIDGKKIDAFANETVLQAMLRHDIKVPHFCYHPKLSIAGVCRMCCVEVEGSRRLEVSCSLPVREGMVVHTQSPKVLEGQRSVMEFTLINHPLDCPICDQAGECWLQEYYMAHDRKPSVFLENKVHKDKARPIGPRVMLDQERCILCTRCVRFCDEITKTSELGIFNRGDRSILDCAPGKALTNDYSENVVDICPVGALTSRDFRFDGRVWFLKESDSICNGCARGCNVVLQHRDGTIRRLLPRVNEAVNGHFMCDAGRDVYKWVHDEKRFLKPIVGENGVAKDAPWAETFASFVEKLREIRGNHKPSEILVMLSPRFSNESNEAFLGLWTSLFGRVGVTTEEVTPSRWKGDDILKVDDRNPNSKGCANVAAVAQKRGTIDVWSIAEAGKKIEKGEVKFILALDLDLDAASWFKKAPLLAFFAMHQSLTLQKATYGFPVTTFAEEEGTFTNVDGIEQKYTAAIKALGEAMPVVEICKGLRASLNLESSAGTKPARGRDPSLAEAGGYA